MDGVDMHFDESLSASAAERWHRFWSMSPHAAPRQHPLYGPIEAAQGHRVVYVWAERGGEMVFAGIFCLIPFLSEGVFSEAVCWRGPVFDDVAIGRACLAEARRYFSALPVGRLRVGPRWIFPEAEPVEAMLRDAGYGFAEYRQRRLTGVIEVARGDEALLASFSKSTRQQVRLAQRAGILIRPACSEDEAVLFHTTLSRMARSRGFSGIDKKEFGPTFDHILKKLEYGAILNAFSGENYLGGILLTRDGQTAYSFKMVVNDQTAGLFPTLRLAPLLFFEGMRWARDRGCRHLDVEGYDADLARSGHLAQIHQYKKGFRPQQIETTSQYALTLRPSIDQALRATLLARRVLTMPARLAFRGRQKLVAYRLRHAAQHGAGKGNV